MERQPGALYLLNFVSMWECFSYYGMRVLLVLFMTHVLDFNDTQAFGLYALYTTLVEFGGVIGGFVADRFLGLKRSISLGGWTIALGHLCLTIPDAQEYFFLGLGLIIAGMSLFRSNVAAFLGSFYQEHDPRREAGYTLYYTGINIGGFLASIGCGIVGEVYGWHAGFGLAAIGMLAGNIALILGRKLLILPEGMAAAITPVKRANLWGAMGLALAAPLCAVALYYQAVVTLFFPIIALGAICYACQQIKTCTKREKQGILRLALFILFLILFYGCEEQLGSTLVLFAERHVDRQTLFGTMPASSLTTFNPLTILVIGPLIARLMQKMPWDGLTKIGVSFGFLAAAFGLLYGGCLTVGGGGEVPLYYAITSIVLIALGEILIGPTVFAAASEAAPRPLQGLMMGMVTFGFSLANLLSGALSQMMAITEGMPSLAVYAGGFQLLGLAALALMCGILFFNYRIRVTA